MEGVLLIQAVATWIMVGIIWFVQVVHYPLFSRVQTNFTAYEKEHIRRTSYVVTPVMLIEAISALALVALAQTELLTRLAVANGMTLILIWMSTFLFQVSEHKRLRLAFSKKVIHNLLATNWIRTIAWTLKGGIVIWMLTTT